MVYVTGQHALNLPCDLITSGDWHTSALAWEKVMVANSDNMFFKEYGIEYPRAIPNHQEQYYVANHIRAILDCLQMGHFAIVQGMRDELIDNDIYTEEIFYLVSTMKQLSNWGDIDKFMGSEYFMRWEDYKKNKVNGRVEERKDENKSMDVAT